MSYQVQVDRLNKDDYTTITKLYLLYEINCWTGCSCSDEILDKIYQAYIDSGNYNNVIEYVEAIDNWCDEQGIDFDEIDDYDKMLKEII